MQVRRVSVREWQMRASPVIHSAACRLSDEDAACAACEAKMRVIDVCLISFHLRLYDIFYLLFVAMRASAACMMLRRCAARR